AAWQSSCCARGYGWSSTLIGSVPGSHAVVAATATAVDRRFTMRGSIATMRCAIAPCIDGPSCVRSGAGVAMSDADMLTPVDGGELREELQTPRQEMASKAELREMEARLRQEMATKDDLTTWGGALMERIKDSEKRVDEKLGGMEKRVDEKLSGMEKRV